MATREFVSVAATSFGLGLTLGLCVALAIRDEALRRYQRYLDEARMEAISYRDAYEAECLRFAKIKAVLEEDE